MTVPLAIDETCKIINSMGGYCKGYVVDISKKEEVYKMAEEIRNRIGDVSFRIFCTIFYCSVDHWQVSLLFNNAGVVSGRMLLDTPDHLIERSFNVNIIAHFWVNIKFKKNWIECKWNFSPVLYDHRQQRRFCRQW